MDRVLGCILGGAIGDAFGGAYENAPALVEIDDSEDWELSDDTQLTIATCEAIIEANGNVEPELIAARFANWHRQHRVTGIGASTLKALTELVAGGHWALVGAKGERAAGNGAAMRIAPLAFCLNPVEFESRRTIRDVSRITHHHEEAYAGALAIIIAIRAVWDGQWDGQGSLLQFVAGKLPDTCVKDKLTRLAELDETTSLLEIAERFGNSGYVAESVPLALCGADRIRRLGFRTMLTELIGCGGDTDTIASMAGQITGALIGESGLPAELLARLPESEMVLSVSRQFAACLRNKD